VWTQLMWSYFTRQRSSRLIVEPRSAPPPAPAPLASQGNERSRVYETAHPH